jgi:hypothetical protein
VHRRREAIRAELLAEAAGGMVLGDHEDNLGAALVAELSVRAAFGRWAEQPDGGR